MKKLLSAVLSTLIAISVLGGVCFAEGGITINENADIIWKNGGQYAFGESSADNRYVHYDITSDSKLQFATFTEAGETEAPLYANPFYGTVDKNGNATSKAKTDMAVKLWAKDMDGNIAYLDDIQMKVAPSAVFLFDKPETDDTAKKLTKAELAMGESISGYVIGTAGSAYTLSPDTTYNCYIGDEYKDYLTASMAMENGQYRVDVTALAFPSDKKTDAKVIVYNEQSGKKAVLNITIDNSVIGAEISADQYAVSKTGELLSCIFMDSAAKAESHKSVNITALTGTALDTTDTPELFVIGNDDGYNFTINSRGKFTPDLSKKSPYLTAKLADESKTEIELTAKKGTPDNTAAWVAAVYNTDGYKELAEGEAPAGVIIFKVIVGGEEWKTDLSGTITKNGKPTPNETIRLYTDDGSGRYEQATDYSTKSTIKIVDGEKTARFTFKNIPEGSYKAKTDQTIGYAAGVSDYPIDLYAPVQNYDGSYDEYEGTTDFGTLEIKSIQTVSINLVGTDGNIETAMNGADVGLYSADLTENTDENGNLVPFAVSATDSRGNAIFENVPSCGGYLVASKSEALTATSVTARSNRYEIGLLTEDNDAYEEATAAVGAGRSNLTALLTDSDGTSLSGAKITLGTGGAEAFRAIKGTELSDDSGIYATAYKPGLENGDYTLKLEAADCVITYFNFSLNETDVNGTVDLGELTLDRVIYTVSGQLKQGTSIADVSNSAVILTDENGGEIENYPDSDGFFDFGETAPGVYTVTVAESYQNKAISSSFTVGGKPCENAEITVNASLNLRAPDGIITVSLPTGFNAEAELSSNSLGSDLIYKVAKSKQNGFTQYVFSGLPAAEDYVVSCTSIVNTTSFVAMELSYEDYTSEEININNDSRSCYPKFKLY